MFTVDVDSSDSSPWPISLVCIDTVPCPISLIALGSSVRRTRSSLGAGDGCLRSLRGGRNGASSLTSGVSASSIVKVREGISCPSSLPLALPARLVEPGVTGTLSTCGVSNVSLSRSFNILSLSSVAIDRPPNPLSIGDATGLRPSALGVFSSASPLLSSSGAGRLLPSAAIAVSGDVAPSKAARAAWIAPTPDIESVDSRYWRCGLLARFAARDIRFSGAYMLSRA